MRDLRERVGLVHELRQLRRSEELAHGRRNRFGVDEIVRHQRFQFRRRHAFFDRPLHTQQPNAILIFHQFADRAHPAITEIIDIVNVAATIAQIGDNLQHFENIFFTQGTDRIIGLKTKTQVHLNPAHGGKVVAFRIEEQSVKQGFSRFQGRRFTRTHHPIDIDQRHITITVFISGERIAQISANSHVIHINRIERFDTDFSEQL